jgi:hypothetical protein
MSRHNKANKNNYMQSGRLAPDEMARERNKQRDVDHEVEHKVIDRPPRGRAPSPARNAREE